MLLLLVSTLSALLIAEATARWFFPHPFVGGYPHVRQQIVLDGRPAGIYTTNSLGLRGDEPPPVGSGQQTIIAVGGSTTHCWFLGDDATWPARLQQDLRAAGADVWVGNGGLEGHSTNAHLDFVHELVASVRPGTALFLVGINDLLVSLQKGARGGQSAVERLWAGNMLRTRSRLLQLIGVELRRMRAPRAQVTYRPWFKDLPLSTPPQPMVFARRAQAGLRRYLDNVHRLAAEAAALGVHPVFLTQPMLYQDSSQWAAREAPVRFADNALHISAAQIAALLGVYNRALLQLCRTEGLDCFDLASRVPHDPRHFYDWVHFDEAGADLVAREVANFLLVRRIVTAQVVAQPSPPPSSGERPATRNR